MEEHKITYYDNDTKDYEYWYKDRKLHKEDGPAYISYYPNGNKKCEKGFKDGKRHREDGPARISYNQDGSKHYESWYLCGDTYAESTYNDIIELSKTIVTINSAIMNIKHPSKFIQRKCQEILNGRA
jgi:antitoxin component YwqK of YwqJK toxin-antitoxin module